VSVERRTGFVESTGGPVYFEVVGAGPPLVLTHGAGGNHASWFQQVATFSDRYQVITWDHRGFGRSGRDDGVGDIAVSVADLTAVLDAAGVARAHVVGQSMGGWTALGFALRESTRVATLTLCDTVAGISTPAVQQNWTDYVARVRARPVSNALGDLPAIGRRFVRDDPTGAALYQAIGSLNAELTPATLGTLLTTTWPPDAVASMACPTLFIVGDDDEIFPPAIIRDVAATIAGSRVVEIAGAGHSPYFETPAAWNEAVAAFLVGASAQA
jgi:3-oxoadipate enol-lactonase